MIFSMLGWLLLTPVTLNPSTVAFAADKASQTHLKPHQPKIRKTGKQRKTGARAGPKTIGAGRRGSRPAVNQSMPQEYFRMRRLVAQRNFRGVMPATRQRLAQTPLDGHVHAAVTVACAYFGDFPCVDQSHDEAVVTPSLVVLRTVAKADALRAAGQPREAAALRRLLILENAKPDRALNMYSRLVSDLLLAGDEEAAFDAAWEAVAIAPASGIGWALVARVESAAGDFETAESYLWLADRQNDDSLELSIVASQIYIDHGEPDVAAALFSQEQARVAKSTRYSAAHTRALLAAGRNNDALHSFDSRTWFLGGELWHPDFMATYGLALAHAGHADLATYYAQRLADSYPHSSSSRADVSAIRALTNSQ